MAGSTDKPSVRSSGSYTPFRWRDEPPTEPGWYWHRKKGHEEGVIFAVAPHSETGDLWAHTIDGGWKAPIQDTGEHEWAGPIPKPLEEAESAV